MIRSEHSYPITANSGYRNTIKVQENDLKSNLIKMIEAFKAVSYTHLTLPTTTHV